MKTLSIAAAIAVFSFVRCGPQTSTTGPSGSAAVDADSDGHFANVDCDDTDPSVHPGASDACNFIDDDCDGQLDEDAPPKLVWSDDDGDGYGDATRSAFVVCVASSNQVENNEDCDDTDAAVNPMAKDICNYKDDDCDRFVDEDIPPVRVWRDEDEDGYGDTAGTPFSVCVPGGKNVTNNEDCDDTDAAVNPVAKDICNYKDDDCDRFVDEDIPPVRVWRDEDEDGYGDTTGTPFSVCVPGGKNVTNDEDCDDTDAAVNPMAKDICNYKDDDCDRFVDEDVPPVRGWPDDDKDGYGDKFASYVYMCVLPSTHVSNGVDCDDTSFGVKPTATEICDNGIDDDCDGNVDTLDSDCQESHCGSITSDETWSTSKVHVVTCDTTVTSSATLTLADGAVVWFDSGTTLSAGTTGSGAIKTSGAVKGVSMTSSETSPARGDYAGIVLGSMDTGSDLTGISMTYGGSKGACLTLTNVPGTLTLEDVDVSYCAGDGISVTGGTTELDTVTSKRNADDGIVFSGSATVGYWTAVTSSNNGGVPAVVPASMVTRVDTTYSTYTGNTDDRIEVLGDTLTGYHVWYDAGVPLHVLGTVSVGSSTAYSTTLDVGEGAELQFAPGTGLLVAPGSTYAAMYVYAETAGGVTFTSDQTSPAAGDWLGITIGPGDEGSSMYSALIEYGGGNGKGNLYFQSGLYSSIDSTVIRYSSTYGIYRDTGVTPYIGSSMSYTGNASGNVY